MTDAIPDATVGELWRYPVKSMQGERLDAADVGAHGIEGDRGWAIRDLTTGLMLTARRVPDLLFGQARYVDGAVHITLPDGTEDPDDAALSVWLGRDVRLERAGDDVVGRYETAIDNEHEDTAPWVQWEGPRGSFHDSGHVQVSVVSRATLGDWDPRRFRTNVVLDGPDPDEEAAWRGRTLAVGAARLEVHDRISRCVIPTRPQPGGLERDLDVMRVVARQRGNLLGIGTLVRGAGRIAVGDAVSVAT